MIGFTRIAVGEGIEKRQDDFAVEVAAMAGGNQMYSFNYENVTYNVVMILCSDKCKGICCVCSVIGSCEAIATRIVFFP